jgi:aryl-alcohol dehydrogenase-like predicted oxidoreductase
MEYGRLGKTGLKVSRIAMGCMRFGDAGFRQWTLDEDASRPFFQQAAELGVTFWDTANGYGGGSSEEFVGRVVRKFARREDIVLAAKVSNKDARGVPRVRAVAEGDPRTARCVSRAARN